MELVPKQRRGRPDRGVPRLLYVHMPKTGGSFVTNVMRRAMGSVPTPSQHSSIREARSDHLAGLEAVFGTTRNPFDWMRSLFNHCMHDHHARPRLIEAYGLDGLVDEPREAWAKFVSEAAAATPGEGFWLAACGTDDQGPFDTALGLWSNAHYHFFLNEEGGWGVDYLVHNEHLRAGLADMGFPAATQDWPVKNTRAQREARPRFHVDYEYVEDSWWELWMKALVVEGNAAVMTELGYLVSGSHAANSRHRTRMRSGT